MPLRRYSNAPQTQTPPRQASQKKEAGGAAIVNLTCELCRFCSTGPEGPAVVQLGRVEPTSGIQIGSTLEHLCGLQDSRPCICMRSRSERAFAGGSWMIRVRCPQWQTATWATVLHHGLGQSQPSDRMNLHRRLDGVAPAVQWNPYHRPVKGSMSAEVPQKNPWGRRRSLARTLVLAGSLVRSSFVIIPGVFGTWWRGAHIIFEIYQSLSPTIRESSPGMSLPWLELVTFPQDAKLQSIRGAQVTTQSDSILSDSIYDMIFSI